jgi:hypothetical protein
VKVLRRPGGSRGAGRADAGTAAAEAAGRAGTPAGDPAAEDSRAGGAAAARPAGKGRPTPKRRDAEKRRRQVVAAPANRREAYRRRRADLRAERRVARRALATGDEANLPPRDAGPVRRYVRDIVDSRHNTAILIVLMIFLSLGLGSVRSIYTQDLVYLIDLAVIVGLVVDNWLLVRTVRRLVRAKFGEETRGLGAYAVMRALQFRRFRMPPPRVKRGERPA